MKKYLDDRIKEIEEKFPEFKNFLIDKLEPLSPYSQVNYMSTLNKFLTITNKINPTQFTQDDIRAFISHESFKNLRNKSKNHYLICIKKYLQYFKRDDLVAKLPKYSEKKTVLSKNELITREDLNKILQLVNIKKKAMIMVIFEGALRRKEAVNILFKDVEFSNGFVDLYIRESKTLPRNIPLLESIPYLKEYFSLNNFEPDDRIFDFHEAYITLIFSRLNKEMKEKHPNWKKNLHPHLLRHSRLTELATTKLNEPLLRQFAGWTKNSQMPEIYFHLDSTDVRNVILAENGQKTVVKKQKPKTFKPIKCEICNSENNQQNPICWKCGQVFDEKKFMVARLTEPEKISELETKNKKLNEKINNLTNQMNNMWEYIKRGEKLEDDKRKLDEYKL